MKYIFVFVLVLNVSNCIDFIKLKFKRDYVNSITEDNIIDELVTNYISVPLLVGTPSQSLRLNLKLSVYPTYIISENVKKDQVKYNRMKSTTFVSDHNLYYFDYDELFMGEKANDTFIIDDSKNKVDDFLFCLETDANMDDWLKVNSGVIGLDVSYKKSLQTEDTNFIMQIKKKLNLLSYDFVIRYIDEDEGEIVIGAMPHQISEEYKKEAFVGTNTINYNAYLYWGLEFENISYGDKGNIENVSHIGLFEIETGVIKCPKEFFEYLNENVFKEFIDSNQCTIENKDTLSYFVCNSKAPFKKINDISFYHRDFNYTFTLSPSDLLYSYKDQFYYLVISDSSSSVWTLGKQFLKKYPLLFNPDKKLIGFYKPLPSSSNILHNLFILSLIIIIILLLFFIIKFFILNKRRMKRAIELDDGFDYTPAIAP